MQKFSIALMPGDGIGPDVIAEAVKVLRVVERELDGVEFDCREFRVGAGEYLRSGDPMAEETFQAAGACDAILLGAMGLPTVRGPGGKEIAPQLDLRERLELYAGARPIRLFHPEDSPLRDPGTIDFLMVRENTEGMFWSRKEPIAAGASEVVDRCRISRAGSERLFHWAFRRARERRKKVTLVDKSNVLPSMLFMRRIFDEIAGQYPDINSERVYVDAMSLYMVQRPHSFDVIVTENLFGDILSDLAASLVGGMGMAPSGDIGEKHAVFQPSHGTAPDIAGKGIANPVATILSAAMMLEWLPGEQTSRGASLIYDAVNRVFAEPGQRTRDMHGSLTTTEMGDLIAASISGD
jgi:3-isopropylmalate dehydrogenase